jgi:hypothetical protein
MSFLIKEGEAYTMDGDGNPLEIKMPVILTYKKYKYIDTAMSSTPAVMEEMM